MKHYLLSTLTCLLINLFVFAQPDTTPTPQWRPLYHFTPPVNWMNDPNGLIYLNGVYHLYNQQNPFGNGWGHMSWAHATSTDLVHWKHLPLAIPETIDKDTTWRFSGCNLWDKNNTSGFCKTGGCLVAVYTADQPNLHKESQFIAYSQDGGLTYTNYANNPVIDLHKKSFRDPSVSWNEQLRKWLMVVALPAERKVVFYASSNLKQWDSIGHFGPAGYTSAEWECPSLMQLPVEGQPVKKKWVLAVSAAGAEKGVFVQYFVGNFNGTTFVNDNPGNLILPLDYGDCFYASIPWNGVPNNKIIYIGWMAPGPQDTYPWRGQMSIPRDLGLRQEKEGLRLVQHPTTVIENNLAKLTGNNIRSYQHLAIDSTEKLIDALQQTAATGSNAYWLDAVFTYPPGATVGFKVAQEKDAGHTTAETVVAYDAAGQKLYVDKTRSGTAKMNKDNLLLTAPATSAGNTVHMQILMDKSSLEVFCNGGEQVITTYIFPGSRANGLSVFSNHGKATLQSLKIWNLSGVK